MTKKQKLTPWFPVTTPPTRVGLYEVRYNGWKDLYSWWNGEHFCLCGFKKEAVRWKATKSGDMYHERYRDRVWRGIAK